MPQPGNVLEPSLTEIQFLKSSLLHSIRPDGRSFLESRPVSIDFSSELGWVQVCIGSTRVLVSTHATLVSPRPDRPYEGFVEIRSEVQPMAGVQFERGRSNEEEVLFDRGIDKAIRRSEVVDREALCVVAGYKVWSLCLTVHLLNAQGSALDAAVLGCMVALRHFRRPDTSVVSNLHSERGTSSSASSFPSSSSINHPRVIVHDESERVPLSMALHHHPLSVTFAIFDPTHLASSFISGIGAGSTNKSTTSSSSYGQQQGGGDNENNDDGGDEDDEGIMILIDPSPLETTLCTSSLVVVANAQGEICVLDKAGGRPLSQSVLQRAIQIARRRVKELTQTMDKALQKDTATRVVDVL